MGHFNIKLTFIFIIFITRKYAVSAPADLTQSFIVTSTETCDTTGLNTKDILHKNVAVVPKIYQMRVQSKVSNRYVNTTIISKVKNAVNQSQEAIFSVVLPDTAFISGFIMEVGGKNYTAYVKEKEEARKTYQQAISSGLGAAHIEVSARDSNRFRVSVNIEPESKAAFYLHYEQLLKREDGQYELVINLHAGQPVKDLNVEVVISESRRITDLKTPPIRSGNEISNENSELDPRSSIDILNDTFAIVKFTPSLETQKQFAQFLGTNKNEGLAGQFVVQYDVERDPKGGEILIQDGYFVHFFAPTNISSLPKHVIFVLDTSYSMFGEKIEQLKEAMSKILGELREHDLFNLVEFNTNVKVWDLNNHNNSVWYPNDDENSWRRSEAEDDILNYTFPSTYLANNDKIKKAQATITELKPNGGTDIHNALTVGLHLINITTKIINNNSPQPMIVFLTDGDPTIGITSTDEIITKISQENSNFGNTPIFTLSFGNGADKKFLQKLSLRNFGFSRHIYEAADASLQLQDFYRQISSPLLSNVTFKYEPTTTSLTKTEFSIHFGGSEIVVAGWCGTNDLNPIVEGHGINGNVYFTPVLQRPVSSVERLWAYLTIKQLLEKKETSDTNKEELKQKALHIALNYSFVTPVSSLVVIKPNDTSAIETEAAEKGQPFLPYAQSLSAPQGVHPLSGDSIVADRFGYSFAIAPIQEEAVELEDQEYEESFYTTVVPVDNSSLTETPTTEVDNIFVSLPWLENIWNDNDTITLPSGEYKIGINDTLTEIFNCPETPLKQMGHCALLNACSQVHHLLTNVSVFVQHFCILKEEYAGICCPDQI